MSTFLWEPSFEVNIKIIDEQHKKLVETVNILYDSIVSGESSKVLFTIFERMVEYVTFHFETEEELMVRLSFPGFQEHKHEHEECTKKVLEFKHKFENGEKTISIELISFLVDWIHHHLLCVDMKYAAFFKEKGITPRA
ncbi:MAG TPA: bacteriohemerythrin [Candidatus Omnitrophota bacterium]|nr:bacteriohemerythrin [Candidatus Omnitrophota bacterium]HQL40684.1 bacteriohemerythrin [Candidatus Omnitrophota bacterium]